MRRLVVLGVAVGLLAAAPASAYRYHPPLREGQAERYARAFLVKHYPGWRYRQEGYVDCRFGRINRYTRACRVGWRKGGNCWLGRMQIQTSYVEAGIVYYKVHFRARRC